MKRSSKDPQAKEKARKVATSDNGMLPSPTNQEWGRSGAINTNTWMLVVLVVSTCFTAVNIYEMQLMKAHHVSVHDVWAATEKKEVQEETEKPSFVTYGKSVDTGHLKHVFAVLKRLGYLHRGSNYSSWDLMWAHDYPFRSLYSELRHLKPHQKKNKPGQHTMKIACLDSEKIWISDHVNHFPGCGYITNKVDLATSDLPYIPRAFRIPDEKEKLIQYASNHPHTMFIQKNNSHRGIRVREFSKLELDSSDTFVQEFVSNPLLVDGYKFDIGLYTILTSIDPLRVYIYNAEVLFRFCPVKYHPFDPEVVDKYVVGDDYLPVWQVPSLQKYYIELGYSMKESFNAYMKSKGANPTRIWDQVEEAIRLVYLTKEPLLVDAAARYGSSRNFFEMVRFDFVVDEDLKVHVMEANMSPNLSSAHFPPNKLMYEQVLFNLFALVGIGQRLHASTLETRSREEELMQVAEKNLMVSALSCGEARCRTCLSPECQLCRPCLTAEAAVSLRSAYLEHVNRLDCKRVFPPVMSPTTNLTGELEDLSPANQLMYRWFLEKCKTDASWCS